MQLNFENETILITGATRGIGEQIANDLYLLGATLILTGTKPKEIEKLNVLATKNAQRKKYFCVDFSDERSLDLFLNELQELTV